MNHVLMKIIHGICLLLPAIPLGAQNELPELPSSFIQVDTLDNGLQVVYQTDPSVDEVAIEFWMKAGVAHEEADQYGLAHFYEHVTPYGLEGKPEKRVAFDSFLTGSNAQTLKDFTRYYLKTKPAGLAVTLEYAADRMAADATAITDSKVEHQRERVLSEIGRQSKHPFWSLEGATALDQAAFGPDHPYGHSGYGTLENNQQFAVSDFQKWHDRYLQPGNSILFIVGNFEESKARILVKKYFASIPEGKGMSAPSIPLAVIEQRMLKSQTQTKSEAHHRVFVWPLPEYGHPDHPVLLLSAYVLENRIKQVQPDGWSMPGDASPGVLHRTYRKGGQLIAYLPFSEASREKQVSQQLGKVVSALLSEGITSAELAMAKEQVAEDMHGKLDWLGFQSSRTELIGQGLLFAGDPGYYHKEWQQLEAATVGQVTRAMKHWLGNDAAEVTILGQPKTSEEDKNK